MRKIIVGLMLFVFASASHANDAEKLKSEVRQLCEKTKACTLAEMRKSLPENMQAMAEGMIEGVCASVEQNYNDVYVANSQAIYRDAVACVSSMSNLSCEALMNGEQTSACEQYNETARNYSNQ